MAEKGQMAAEFASITGVDVDRAMFYLESAAWDLQVGLGMFYDEMQNTGDDDTPMSHPPSSDTSAGPANPSHQPNKMATLWDISGDDDEEEEGQRFYAGGSDRSGQQIIGPPKEKKKADDYVEELFKSAKEHGATSIVDEPVDDARGPNAFSGAGFKLGDGESPSMQIGKAAPGIQRTQQEVDMVLKLWRNGFSVDDGPLREFNSDENKQFIDAINKGEVPAELTRKAHGGQVNLNMEDHRTEEYVAPKVTTKAFGGSGHRLGNPTPSIVSPSTTSPMPQSNVASSSPAVSINETEPVTNVQIRLADGSRLTARFNHSHTVADIRFHIVSNRPEYSTSLFHLMTTFPNKKLENEDQTLKDANLLNSVVVQRLD